MVSSHSIDVARRAQELYELRFRSQLEATHFNEYVAIEPDSGEFFLGKTLSEAIIAARQVHPQRISFALRVGHPSGIHLGELST